MLEDWSCSEKTCHQSLDNILLPVFPCKNSRLQQTTLDKLLDTINLNEVRLPVKVCRERRMRPTGKRGMERISIALYNLNLSISPAFPFIFLEK